MLRSGPATLHPGREQDMRNVAGEGGCSIMTAQFDSVLAKARQAGASFYMEPSRVPTGQRTFGNEDPDGNLIAFVEVQAGDPG